jgi:hypothetical protein
MPYWLWIGGAFVLSKVLANTTESVENVASAGQKAAFAGALGLGGYLLYKKAVK